ncbi:MAG: hypothetical protein IJB47_05365 [Oscillospiraceae bacterium]|nr:hypothetical protein [Oscillospiraceae bacterium]
MKKLRYVIPGLLLAVIPITVMLILGINKMQTQQQASLTVLDSKGQVMAELSSPQALQEDDRWAYLEYAIDEAAWVYAKQNAVTQEEAVKLLFNGNYVLKTAFDPAVFAAVEKAGEKWGEDFPIGCAIIDLEGNLVAIYSTPGQENQARLQTSPYSTLKPLSVYAPAVEAGISRWSVRYEDSPYKQLPAESGGFDWPSNASGTYSREKVFMYQAVKNSLNTIAVKSLADLGVAPAIAFLQGNFPLNLDTEAMRLEQEGEEEIIGNIALGHLQTGVSAVDMAGCYQIFATGGKYTQFSALTQILDSEGNRIYAGQPGSYQTVSPETADIVRKMLQGVVSQGGVGEKAACQSVEVAGQTGIRDDRSINWFVGVTPGYSCAVRHGQNSENLAPEIFAAIMDEIYAGSEKPAAFENYGEIVEIQYCTQSAMAATDACPATETGYYAANTQLGKCTHHATS